MKNGNYIKENRVKENHIEDLIYLFSKLPGLGPRSARRIVLYLLEDKKHRMNLLSNSLIQTSENTRECVQCYNIDTITPCSICEDTSRDRQTIAIVETVADLWALERSRTYTGLFHVLGNSLNARDGRRSEDLRLPALLKRSTDLGVRELIIATNATIEGQTTAYYITEFFKNKDMAVTRLASGIPIGGELDYLDEGTLAASLNLRLPF